jgi:hypothetical protein
MQQSHKLTRNQLWLISIARNIAAFIVTLLGAATIMFVRWPNAINDVLYVTLVASLTGLIASIIGKANGFIWFIAWMAALMPFNVINNWPVGDPEWGLGLCIHSMFAFPIIPIGYLVRYIKIRLQSRA